MINLDSLKAKPEWVCLEIIAVIPEYDQAVTRSASENQYALTPHAEGFDIERCREGARVKCLVTMRPDLPRVLKIDFDWCEPTVP
jgi:hypothetical protein